MRGDRKRDRDDRREGREDSGRSKLARMEAESERRRRTVIVSQLTSKVTEETLESFFGQLGRVVDVAMPRSDKGKNKGIAYVEMNSSEDVLNCVLLNNSVPDFQKFPILVEALKVAGDTLVTATLPNTGVPGVDMNAGMAGGQVPPPPPMSAPANGNVVTGVQTKVLIRNIHANVETQALLDVLQYYGPVSEIHFQKSQNIKMAFVTFGDASAAYSARDALHKFELGGFQLEFSLVKSSEDNSSGAARVIISVPLLDIPSDPSEEELISDIDAECAKEGIGVTVTRKDPRLRASHEKRGQKGAYALLKCENATMAKKAVSAFDGRFYSGRLMTAYLYGS
jgi:RNA recognition motif-containing protein